MARRKPGQSLSDYSSDDSNPSGNEDDIAGDEDREFHQQRKRRRIDREDGKKRAWEGIFGSDDEEGGYRGGGRGGGRGGRSGGRGGAHAAFKAPTFTSGSATATNPRANLVATPAPEDQPDSDSSGSSSSSTTRQQTKGKGKRKEGSDVDMSGSGSDDGVEVKGPKRTRENSYDDSASEGEQPRGLGIGAGSSSSRGGMGGRGGFTATRGRGGGTGSGSGSGAGRGGGGIGMGGIGGRGGGGIGSKAAAGEAVKPLAFGMASFAKSSGTEQDQADNQSQKQNASAGENNVDVSVPVPTSDTPGFTSSRPHLPRSQDSSAQLAGLGSGRRHDLEAVEEKALYPAGEDDEGMGMGMGMGFKAFGGRGRLGDDSAGGSRESTPGASSSKPRQQKSFLPKMDPSLGGSSSPKPKAFVPEKDLRHLQNISSSFGARLLAKQGWAPGKGLGKEEDGKAVPIEANIGLSRGQGIGKGVRTEQSKREAKERGELSSDEDEKAARRKRDKKKEKVKEERNKGENAEWKGKKKIKVKVQHKTYEELLAENEGVAQSQAGVGLVLDARSGEMKQVSSMAELAARAQTEWTPTGDKTQLPELRHNLRMILDSTKGDLGALIKESQGVRKRRDWAKREVERLKVESEKENNKIARLREIQGIVKEISKKAGESVKAGKRDPQASLGPLQGELRSLMQDYKEEYEEYDLDEVVIGALSQVLGSAFREYSPLEESGDKLLNALLPLRKTFRYSDPDHEVDLNGAIDVYGLEQIAPTRKAGSGVMTPFEALLNQLWLPKVRSSLNNEWQPTEPQPAVHLLESWSPLLPRFMRDNILDQLILPKLSSLVRDWSARRSKYSLASVVFPWLSPLKDRADEILDEAKLRIGEVMKRWTVRDGIPEELGLWRDVFSKGKWDTLILLNILPKLASSLEADFEVNPRDQQMEPLDRILRWSKLMRESTFSQLLEEKFFPVWLDTLHFWLVQPNYSAGEVASWYNIWKEHLAAFSTADGKPITEIKGIDHGFRAGLKLMSEAMTLGSDAPHRLQKPVFKPLPAKSSADKAAKESSRRRPAVGPQAATEDEVTFRSIAESYASERNLLFLPTGKSHTATGKQLFKVSKTLDGRGATVYVGADAVYAQVEDGSFRAVLLDDMVKMAGA